MAGSLANASADGDGGDPLGFGSEVKCVAMFNIVACIDLHRAFSIREMDMETSALTFTLLLDERV